MNKDELVMTIKGGELIAAIDARREYLEKEIGDCSRSLSRIGMLQGHVDELRALVASREQIRHGKQYAITEL